MARRAGIVCTNARMRSGEYDCPWTERKLITLKEKLSGWFLPDQLLDHIRRVDVREAFIATVV